MATCEAPSNCGEEGRQLQVVRQPERRGYDCEFVQRPQSAFQSECPICLLILHDPHQATCCGKSFCKACVKFVQADKEPCPTCKKVEFKVYPNKGLKQSLNEFRVYCSHKEEGCKWEGELAELDKHLNLQPPPDELLVGCQFSEVGCSYCSESFQRHIIQSHQSDECPKRPYSCQHCRQYSSTFEDVTQEHWAICGSFPLFCPNNCESIVQRQEVEQHASQDCPLAIIACNFKAVGCEVRLTRRDMPSHISANLAEHMTCMLASVADQKKTIQCLQAKIAEKDQQLRKHQQILEKITGTGSLPFDCTMPQFEKRKRNYDVWFSPPFYTHTHGYKLCLNVYANSYGSDRGTHVTVGLQLMGGEFDNDLQWPFHGVITIQLLNQLEDNHHFSTIIDARNPNNPEAVKRVYGERADVEYSSSKFVPHSQLGISSDGRCQFLKDDKLIFRVSKATNIDPIARLHRRCLRLEGHTESTEPKVCVPPITFLLSEFQQHKQENSKWQSPPFYSHPQGYRMCLQVFPNGDDDGASTHVSVYNCIMQGPFDKQLKWPFRGDVTIKVVNQKEDDNHTETTIPYTNETPDTSAGRVTNGERSDGWGFDKFLQHSSLDLNTLTNTQYLLCDTLRIQVVKVTSKNRNSLYKKW